MTDKSVVPEGMKPWTVWDAEERMAREGDWRGVAYSIAHDILPLIPEGSPDHAYQERARMQIKAADRLTAAVLAAASDKSTTPSNPLNLETSDLDPITPEEDALATAIIAAEGVTRQSLHGVVRVIRAGLAKAGAVIVPTSVLTPFLSVAPYMKGRNSIVTSWNNDRVEYADFRALSDAVPVPAHSIQSGGEGGEG